MTKISAGVVLMCGAMLLGCGKGIAELHEGAASNSAPAQAPKTLNPTVTAETGGLPANFPKDVPIYPGAKVVAGATSGADAGVTFETSDPPEKVMNLYKEELPRNGWKEIKPVSVAGLYTVGATKDGRTLGITITALGSSKTNITVGVSDDK